MSDINNTTLCNDECELRINIEDIEKIYDSISAKVYKDMDKQYKESKISGVTYAETWAKIMSTVINSAITGVVSLQSKETAADRAVKYEGVESSKNTTTRSDNLALDKIKNDDSLATANVSLIDAKKKAEDLKNGDKANKDSLYGHNISMVAKQTALYERQAKGFDDNARQKYLDTLTGPYSILFQDLDLLSENRPSCLMQKGIDQAAAEVFQNIDGNENEPITPTPPGL